MGTRNFTASITVEDVEELREERDRTDDDIREEFNVEVDQWRVDKERASAAHSRAYAEKDAINGAVSRVIHQARNASAVALPRNSDTTQTTTYNPLDLQGATLTITFDDLVATAVLTLPTGPTD